MATVTLGGTPTVIDNAEAVTNWTNDTFSLEPDNKVQGSNSVSATITPNAGNTQEIWVAGSWDFSVGTGVGDQHLRLWANITFNGNLQTEANNGWQIFISDGTNYSYWTVAGSDTYAGGWKQFVVYTGNTPDETSGTVSKAAITQIGMRFKTLTKPRNVPANAWFDAWTYGDGYYITGGISGDEINLSLIAASDLTNAYGIVTEQDGVFYIRGDLQIGNGTTTTWFKSDTEIVVFPQETVNIGVYKISGNGSGCRIDIADTVIKSDGTAAKDKFDFDMSETNLLTTSCINSQFVNGDEIIFKSSQTITGNVYNGCGQITHGGADLDNGIVKGYEGTANTSALVYNVNADPDGEMDGMTFIQGTVLTHGIEFGITSPLTMTLRNQDFQGYSATNNVNNSHFHIKRTTGTVTINLIGCTKDVANFSYRSDGAIVILQQTVSLTITVKDKDTRLPIQNVQTGIKLLNSPFTQLMNEDTDASGIATEAYGGSTPVDVVVTTRKSDDLDSPRYIADSSIQEITTSGLSLTVSLKKSPIL